MSGTGRRRATIAVVVLLAWAVGMGALVKREFFRPKLDRLSEAALRVAPGAVYYAVFRDGQQVGYASSTVDTTRSTIQVRDYLVADVAGGGAAPARLTTRTAITLSRGLHIRDFAIETHAAEVATEVGGRVEGDSVIVVGHRRGTAAADTQRVRVPGPVLLPSLLPLALALGERPEVGKTYSLPVFDPAAREARDVALPVDAESLFVIADSAVFDSTARRWVGALPDTVRAWHVTSRDAAGFTGWVDEMGRLVEGARAGGLTIRRTPHEVAFENWRTGATGEGPAPADSTLLESTAVGARLAPLRPVTHLVVRLRGADLRAYELHGGRQRLVGDTLDVRREDIPKLRGTFRLDAGTRRDGAGRLRMPEETSAELLVESDDPQVQALGRQLVRQAAPEGARTTTSAGDYARALVTWVHDSVTLVPSIEGPGALQVLRDRRGGAMGVAQLAVALARARGLPARIVSGYVYANGRLYAHVWPEFFLWGWVAVDPALGQFPADASHLRVFTGGLDRQAELVRLADRLSVNVLQTTP